MVDFIGSLQKGLSAAHMAEKNKLEINSVFSILNEQLFNAFEGKIKVGVYNRVNPFGGLLTFSSNKPKPESQFIGAKNPLAEDQSAVELAGWKIDANGYPCHIITADAETYCENKTALEYGLQYLLSLPDVGEKVLELLARKPKSVVKPD
ncbi:MULTISPECIES: hypothetical protein [Pseudomonas]|uniref:hypothetical protein n=1 Tax=Pseudomonas TaxID=286 RepID=UPI000CF5F507|nr:MULTISPECIES: hypothetical protein [Pseudomonas]AVJ40006.1 hypothetical protein CLM75_22675 [Pseudomonas lurida]PRA16321.1 hypothetical protein CQ002_13955 [Pseudomonas sp. MYb13]PRA22195.1 hypothetical protein CQ004_13210 [Pseudomonas lurida]PRA34405.1 hypothetical protein CQ005_17380 [Pseudomonas lurida]PRC00601.1 hypothetical protein CQ014_16465 [Pseudomonas lurida]